MYVKSNSCIDLRNKWCVFDNKWEIQLSIFVCIDRFDY